MALIYRTVLDIEDPRGGFTDRAAGYFSAWTDWKLGGGSRHAASRTQLTNARVEVNGWRVFRGALFERGREDGAELRTQFVALTGEGTSVAWVDLDRWASDTAGEIDWTPMSPSLIGQILREEVASRGSMRLHAEGTLREGSEGAELADLVVAEEREVPVVAIAYRPGEDNAHERVMSRANQLAKRLAGVATVAVLGEGAVSEFSKRMLELVGEDMDVHTGGVRCYLPGVGSPGDHPQRHFALFYRALEGRAPDRAALRIAPVLQRQALDTSPPRVWEELRSHVDGADPDERTITVQRLIGRGESTQIEFKASMRWDIAQQRVNKELTKAVAKTMCAFLNSHGGTLLIGVADDGTPVGIEHDIRSLDPPNVDRVHLTIRAALGEHLGEDVSPLIDVTFSEIAGHTVAVLSCSAHDLPVFYDEGGSVKFFIRAGNASPPLDVREALDYVRRHWPAQLWES